MKLRWIAFLVVAVSCTCCDTKSHRASPEGTVNQNEKEQRVSVVGIAREAKVGPVVVTENGIVWIGDPNSPNEASWFRAHEMAQ